MNIRSATKKDIAAVLNLANLFKQSPFWFDTRFRELSDQFHSVFANEIIRKSSSITLVAEEANRVIGFITVSPNKAISPYAGMEVGSILLLAVDENYRGRGIGRQLAEKGCALLFVNGVELITVGTDAYNIPALHIYESLKFQVILCWHIFRYYPDRSSYHTQKDLNPHIEPFSRLQIEQFKQVWHRPIPLLKDKRVNTQQLKNYLTDQFHRNLIAGKTFGLHYWQDGKAVGMINFAIDRLAMDTLGTKIPIYKILDLMVLLEYRNQGIELAMIRDCLIRMGEYLMVEMWVEAEDRDLIEALEDAGFRLAYTGISLHRG